MEDAAQRPLDQCSLPDHADDAADWLQVRPFDHGDKQAGASFRQSRSTLPNGQRRELFRRFIWETNFIKNWRINNWIDWDPLLLLCGIITDEGIEKCWDVPKTEPQSPLGRLGRHAARRHIDVGCQKQIQRWESSWRPRRCWISRSCSESTRGFHLEQWIRLLGPLDGAAAAPFRLSSICQQLRVPQAEGRHERAPKHHVLPWQKHHHYSTDRHPKAAHRHPYEPDQERAQAL